MLGAVQYNFRKFTKKTLKISFFVKKDYSNRITDLNNYLNDLKSVCENRKKISFSDINLRFIDDFRESLKIKDS